ncbi:MAG: glycosyltransferase family 25 protein [Porticoccaceae bacterium]
MPHHSKPSLAMDTRYKTYIINLPKDSERLERLSQRLGAAGLDHYQIVPAIDGRTLAATELAHRYDDSNAIKRSGRTFTPGEIGCALSHQKAYQSLLTSAAPWALILEDDAEFADALPPLLDRANQWLDNPEPRILLFTPLRAYLEKNAADLTPEYRLVSVVKAWDGAGYGINRAAAQALVAANNKIQLMADDWMAYRERAGVNIRGLDPWLIRQMPTELSTLESERNRQRRHKNRILGYRLSKLRNNLLYKLREWLWWRPFCGLGSHRNSGEKILHHPIKH